MSHFVVSIMISVWNPTTFSVSIVPLQNLIGGSMQNIQPLLTKWNFCYIELIYHLRCLYK